MGIFSNMFLLLFLGLVRGVSESQRGAACLRPSAAGLSPAKGFGSGSQALCGRASLHKLLGRRSWQAFLGWLSTGLRSSQKTTAIVVVETQSEEESGTECQQKLALELSNLWANALFQIHSTHSMHSSYHGLSENPANVQSIKQGRIRLPGVFSN